MIISPSNLSLDWNDPVNKSHALNRGLIFWAQVLPDLYGYGSKTWFDLVKKRRGISSGWDGDEWGGYAPMKGSLGSFRLDGSNDYIYWPNIVPSNITEFTFVAKVNLSSTGNNQGIIALYDSATPSNRSNVALYGSGSAVRYWDNNNGWMSYTGVYTFGTTLHVVVTVKSSGENKLYHNGVEVNSRTLGSMVGKNSVAVGASNNSGGEYAKGQLDCLRVYNRLLSAAEVMALYQADIDKNFVLFNFIDILPHLVRGFTPTSTTANSNLKTGIINSNSFTATKYSLCSLQFGSINTVTDKKSALSQGTLLQGQEISSSYRKNSYRGAVVGAGIRSQQLNFKTAVSSHLLNLGFSNNLFGGSGKIITCAVGSKIQLTGNKVSFVSTAEKVGYLYSQNYFRTLATSSNLTVRLGNKYLGSAFKAAYKTSSVHAGIRTYAIDQNSTPKFYIGIYKRI